MSEGARTNFNLPTGSAPYDYQSLLQQTPDERRVIAGAGGSIHVLTLEDTIIAPSDEGVEGSKWGNPVKTNDPTLGGPDLSNVGIWHQELGSDFVSFLTGLEAPVDTSQGKGVGSTAEEEAYIKLATLMHATGAEEPLPEETVTVTGGGVDISSAFKTWLRSFALDFNPTALIPTKQEVTDRQNLQSTDPAQVKTALLTMANLDSLNLDPEIKKFVEAKIGALADMISLVNQTGGNGYLNLTVPGFILPILMGALNMPSDTSLSPEQRESLSTALVNISTKLAENNFKSLLKTQTPSLEYTTLTSGDSTKIASLLKVMCQTANLVIDLPPEQLSQIMDSVGTELAKIDPEKLATMDDATVQQTVSNAFDAALSSLNIPDDLKASLKSTLGPVISKNITNICGEKLTADLHSGDPVTTMNALTTLLGVDTDPNLTPAGRAVVRDYLKAMTAALVFLAQIRATIASLEGTVTQELAKTKLKQIANQVTNAVELLKNEFSKADKVLKNTLHQIDKAKLMKWLMPFIALIVAIVMLVVIITVAVGTVLSGGSGAPALVMTTALAAQIIGLCVAATVATATAVVAAVDLAMSASTGKGVWDALAEAAGVSNNPALKALLVTAIQLIADVIMIVGTLGVGAAVVGVQAGAAAAMSVAKEAAKLLVDMGSIVGQTVVGSIISAVMSGGLITLGLAKLGELIFGDQEKGNIFAIVMTVIIMIALCLISGKFSAGGAKAGADEAGKIGTTAAQVGQAGGGVTEVSVKGFAQIVATTLQKLLKALGGAVDEGTDISAMGLKELLAFITQLIKQIAMAAGGSIVNSLKDTAENLTHIPGKIEYQFQRAALVFQSRQLFGAPTTFSERLLEYMKEVGPDMVGNLQGAVKLTASGLQMYASYLQYKAAKCNQEFQEQMASLESISSSLQAIISMLENMKGNDATKVIEDITQGAQDLSDKWVSLVQLVESMIQSASSTANKLVTV